MADLHPSYLVLGTDPARVTMVVDRLKSHFPPEAVEQHPASKDSATALVDSFGMMSMFAEQRLVIVTSAQDWAADDVSKVLDYVKTPAPDVVLLLIADKLAGNSRLKKAFAKPRLIECPGPDKPDTLRSWVEQRFVELEAQVARPAVKRLIELCCGIDPNDSRAVGGLDGNDLARLRTDVERISTYAGGDPITVAMIDDMATRVSDEKVWVIGDAWARKDKHQLLTLIEQLLDQREHPVRLAGALARHLRQVDDAWHLLQSMGPGRALDELVASGANQWAAKKVVQQAQQVSGPQIDAALSRVALLDAELKGANALGSGRIGEDSGAGARIVLQRGLLELA